MAKLEKMTIMPCSVDNSGNISKITGESLQVMINPSLVTHDHSIRYSKSDAIARIGNDEKFNGINAEKLSFNIRFDGTGVISNSTGKTVKEEVSKFKNIVYIYKGDEHQTRPVCICWGSFLFYGRLESLSLQYTLFKPSGEPLRASTSLSFKGYMSKEEEALRANKSSPDLTHLVEVQAGDTLPLLCHRIYRNPAYYPEVARINGLNSPQALHPGLKLKFPPLS
ncbi:CIS tube protein [Candidatus Electronema sp. PJ]|uniref:CIS tube protein n=1 Tax=Candidatus Electronema sp. PJ TaxID=3401572 RepID=UPI003AA7E655